MVKEKTLLEKPKKSWMKRLFKIFTALVILTIALVIGVYLTLGTIVKRAITTAVPPVTGTAVTVDTVDLSLLKGHIAFEGFGIANPKGFAAPDAFSLGSIVVNFEPKSVLSDKIIINNVSINKTMIAGEINQAGQINLMVLQNNIQNYVNTHTGPSKGAAKTETKASTTDSGTGKKVIVKKLTIDGTELKLGAMGQMIQINLPKIEKTGIGEDNQKQYTIQQTVALVMSYLSEASVQGVMNSGNQIFIQSLKDTKAMLIQGRAMIDAQVGQVKQTADELKQKGEDVKKMGEDMKNAGTDLKDSVKDLGSLFGK